MRDRTRPPEPPKDFNLCQAYARLGVRKAVTMQDTLFLTTKEASELTRLACPTLHRFRVVGGGPAFVKIGSKVLYRREDLLAFMNARLRRSTSDDGSAAAA